MTSGLKGLAQLSMGELRDFLNGRIPSMDLQVVALQLVRVCKTHHRKSLALNTVLAQIMRENPETRARLTPKQVQEMMSGADHSASQIVNNEFQRLEQAFVDGTDFASILQEYLDRNL